MFGSVTRLNWRSVEQSLQKPEFALFIGKLQTIVRSPTMKFITALGLSTFCLATSVWAEPKAAPTQAATKPAAAVASASLGKPSELPKFVGTAAPKAISIPELKKLQASLKKVELAAAAQTAQPTAPVAPTPTAPAANPYQQGSGVLLTVNSMRDSVTRSYLQMRNMSVGPDSMIGPMRWLAVNTCTASEPLAEAVFYGIPSGRHTYMATVVMGPNNGTSPDPVFIEVAGSRIAANAITRNGFTARVLFTYDSASGNSLTVKAGWTGGSTAWVVYEYTQLAAID